jgi:hypothetical protein
MERKNVRIKGTSQYGYSKFVDGQKTPKSKEARMKGAWERVYRTEDGSLFIPGTQVKACILHAALLNEYKIGKSKARAQELIKALARVEPAEIPIELGGKRLSDADLIYFEGPTKVTQGKQEMVTTTGVYTVPEWEIACSIVVIGDLIELPPLIEQLDFGGIVCGIGAKRSWGWGRFEIMM